MDYDALPIAYWQEQVQRILSMLSKIQERAGDVVKGRQVPEDEVLLLGSGRHLSMAVLFLDICGFSSRPSATAAQQAVLVHVFNLFFSELIRISEDYGGTVEKNTGDGLMVYFEDSGGNPPEDGCKRAIAAALTMLYATQKAINPILENASIQRINFRVGIDHGDVTIAEVGAARRFRSRVAIGATANIASKILEVAGPDEIVIGDQVRKRLPPAWSNQFAELHTQQTGWIYVLSGAPYPFYRYTGRWRDPK
jgi:class 3 adenylate cyclase